MNKILLLFAFTLLFTLSAFSQDFTGFTTNAYAGVNSLEVNPANVVGTIYKLDICPAAFSINQYNNYLGKHPTIPTKWKLPKFAPVDFNTNNAPRTDIYEHARYVGPSVLFDIDRFSAFAVTTQARSAMLVNNIPANLGQSFNAADTLAKQPTTGNATDLKVNFASWTEFGGTYGRLSYFNGGHRIKYAARVKYLGGLAALAADISSLDYSTTNADTNNVTITDATALYAHTPTMKMGKFKFQGSGFGLDLGIKYSFYNNVVFGISVMDIGSIKYKKLAPSGQVKVDNSFNVGNNYGSVAEFDESLEKNTTNTPSVSEVIAQMPTALSFNFTAFLWKNGVYEGGGYHNFYVSLLAYQYLKNTNPNADIHVSAPSSYTLTVGFNSFSTNYALPLTINEFGDVSLGGMARLGPFIIGSKNVLSSLWQKEVHTTEVYFGLKIPFIKPKPTIVQGCPKRF